MKKILICFGGSAYDATTQLIVTQAPKYGVDEVRIYDDKWLMEQEFYRLNKWWWTKGDQKYGHANRGFGWFIWKPFILMHALEHSEPGDIVLFTDADTYPIANLAPIYDRCAADGGIMLFNAVGCWHTFWSKRDTMIVMGQDEPQWRDRQHAVARFMLFQKGPWRNQQFLMEWLTYCLNPFANTFDASLIKQEYPELHEPRCEQAILTNLAHKYGLRLYREACQNGATQQYDQDIFPQLFIQDGRVGNQRDVSGSRFRNVG